jgi:hypothetical protein
MADTRDNRRREFIRGIFRYPLLAALGMAGGRLATNRPAPLHADETCEARGVCRGCVRLRSCGLPQAALARPVLDDDGRKTTPAKQAPNPATPVEGSAQT